MPHHPLLPTLLTLPLLAGLPVAPIAGASPNANPGPLQPATTGGLPRLERLLHRIDGHRRLLVVGAHPDDEDTSLLAVASLKLGAEAAYLSLSRGEGGQNAIGDELGVGLGLLRSRELLAARQLDGARQYFTRAFDFGYTRSLDETLRLWPRDVLLEDTVRVIRRFRPQVLVAIFPPNARAGHGQHQAAGVIAEEAFAAAGESDRFPRLENEGLVPWRPERLYRSARFRPEPGAIEVPTGDLDPLSGQTFHQIAMASRSQHRSQDFGVLQALGPRGTRVSWLQGAGDGPPASLFDGLDTRLEAIAQLEEDADRRHRIGELLELAHRETERARRGLSPSDLASSLPAIAETLRALREAGSLAQGSSTRALLEEKLELAAEAMAVAAGLSVDTYAERADLTVDDATSAEVLLYNAGPRGASARLEVVASEGWTADPPRFEIEELSAAGLAERSFRVAVAADAPPTTPYFLQRSSPVTGSATELAESGRALYAWPEGFRESWGEPFAEPPLKVRFEILLAGYEDLPLVLEREVVARRRDPARGEVRSPLRFAPPLEVLVAPPQMVWPTSDLEPRPVIVILESHIQEELAGQLEVTAEDGWPTPDPTPFTLAPGARRSFPILLDRPAGLRDGRHRFRVEAVTEEPHAGRYDLSVDIVDYPHIRPTPLPRRARFEISVGELALPDVRSIGYFRGAADLVPESLMALGLPVELLDPRDLLRASNRALDRHDVLVVGSRAYESDEALQALHPRLLEYARRGGRLIVQYQKYPFVRGGYTPYPLDIPRPHGRVSVETAPVRLLDPDHPLLSRPNLIREEDWQGWVQERGLYFAGSWSEEYRPLLEMADPGQEAERGALLIAPLGEGSWVYTGLSFFRQLPAGVIGAYRLFLNLLAVDESEG